MFGSKVTEIVHLMFIFGSGKRRANYPVKKLILDFAFYASDVDRNLLLTRCRDSAPLQKPKNPKRSYQETYFHACAEVMKNRFARGN